VNSPELLTSLELCPRKAHYSRSYEPWKLQPVEMVRRCLRVALCAPVAKERPFGEVAGDEMMQLASDRGVDIDTENHRINRVYDTVLNHAALSDILVSAIRKPADKPWLVPSNLRHWQSACYLSPDGNTLRRIVLVSHWSDERRDSEARSWFSQGEMAHYNLPMQMVVLLIGQMRSGLRRGPWCRGFLHPRNKVLRFRKKSRSTSETFNDKWEEIKREDHDEISREKWLESMLRDDVLPEVCFRVDLPVPGEVLRQRILQMTLRKLERLDQMTEKPEANLSSCDWPTPCPFLRCCHSIPEREPSEKNGFVPLLPVAP
jgi:hypothetical protein